MEPEITAAIIAAVISGLAALVNFTYTWSQNRNKKFMEQLEYFETELTEMRKGFSASRQSKEECWDYAVYYLTVLDRIAYLRNNKLVNTAFVRYFEYYFNTGRAYLIWLMRVFPEDKEWEAVYYHFIKLTEKKNEICYALETVKTFPSFYYHLDRADPPLIYTPPFIMDPKGYKVPDLGYKRLNPGTKETEKFKPQIEKLKERLDCSQSWRSKARRKIVKIWHGLSQRTLSS